MEPQNQDDLYQVKRVGNFVSLSVWGFGGALVASLLLIFLHRLFIAFWIAILEMVLLVGFALVGIMRASKRYQICGSLVGGILGGLIGYGIGYSLRLWPDMVMYIMFSWIFGPDLTQIPLYLLVYTELVFYFLMISILVAVGATLGYLFATKLIKQDYGA